MRLDSRDLDGAIGLLGLTLLGVGFWWWWPPAALIVVGTILLALALWRLR